jgi:hypothetical protein
MKSFLKKKASNGLRSGGWVEVLEPRLSPVLEVLPNLS